jgi:hypothetical protein
MTNGRTIGQSNHVNILVYILINHGASFLIVKLGVNIFDKLYLFEDGEQQ